MLEITEIVRERANDQTGVLCVVLDVGDLVLKFSTEAIAFLAKNSQRFVLIGHSQ